MELHIFLFCLPLFFLLLLKPFLRRATNLPPGPSSLPLIGSLRHLSPRLHESLYNLAKLHGPIITLYLGSITTIVVSSPETAKQVLQIHDQDFSERYIPDVITAQPNPESTLAWVPGNQRWRNRRRICITQMFTKQRLDSQQHLRHLKVQQLIEQIKKLYVLGKQVDIGQVAFATTLNLISNAIFSVDIIDTDFEKAQEFKDLVWRIMEDAGKQNLSDIFPVLKLFDLQGLRRHVRPAYMRLHEIFDEMIEKRLESRKIGSERSGDFLDVLLDQCDEPGSDFDRHNIKPLILVSELHFHHSRIVVCLNE
ncbi:hypothetical protein HS088_TW15G00511 [Tripterygium wilfordii]|uniref:Geraniol 8-hydroxylase-like n=1 Tax=Tripterygium wilfordii TaxID=458696 RepID=A0A7J7CLR6_TRIWF|nr:hypothetical protein HS088_TW15G00511 [Tripterygium wilfordii]